MSSSLGDVERVFQIAREAKDYGALDLSGAGATKYGGRWNASEIPMVYASRSRALAALETLVHIREPKGFSLPLDRYLVEIVIPRAAWDQRELFDVTTHPGWDAAPVSRAAVKWGSEWARSKRSLIATVPSVIVPEEPNVLINNLSLSPRAVRAACGQNPSAFAGLQTHSGSVAERLVCNRSGCLT